MDAECRLVIENPDQVADLPVGQWVWDVNDTPMCLVDTNVGWPQRMFMSNGGSAYTGIKHVEYPLRLADVADGCPHSWGTNECGHCKRCGVVCGPVKNLDWNIGVISRG